MTKDEIRSEVEKIITVISPDDLGGDLCTMSICSLVRANRRVS